MKKMRKAAIMAMLLTVFFVFTSAVVLAQEEAEVELTPEENMANKTMVILGFVVAAMIIIF